MKRFVVRLAAFYAVTVIAACATISSLVTPPAPKTPDQVLYEANAAFTAALLVVTDYGSLPSCGSTVVLPCSNANFVIMADKISHGARDALTSARVIISSYNIVVSPSTTLLSQANAAANAALQAVQAYQTISAEIADLKKGV